jgi:hypothetical protein
VEHIQPKDEDMYPELVGRWTNFLLACVNCNSTKGAKDVRLERVFLPDRDNTFRAFEYRADGTLNPSQDLDAPATAIAENTLRLLGLDKAISEMVDENGKFVAIDRVSQRKQAWLLAQASRADLDNCPTDAMRRQIVRTAMENGFFSIWMKVFHGDLVMRQMFIDGFTHTAADCFDCATTAPVSPRPANGLPHGGKI